MMNGNASSSLNSSICVSRLSWNKRGCKDKRSPVSTPPNQGTAQWFVTQETTIAVSTTIADSEVNDYENVSGQTNGNL